MSYIYEEMGYEKYQEEIILLTEEVYFITKKIYDNYKFVDKSNYDLSIEWHKMEIKTLTDKLMSYHSEQKKIIPNYSSINDKDFLILKKDMEKREYRFAFLEKLNLLRSVGIFEIPGNQFELLTELFVLMSEKIEEEKNNKRILDEESCRYIITFSVTFYCVSNDKNREKIFIRNKIKNHKLFHSKEFWSFYQMNIINNEFRKSENNEKLSGKILNNNELEKRNSNIVFAQLLALVSNMAGFEVSEEIMKDVSLPLLNKFLITQDKREAVLNMISCIKEG